MNLLIAFVILLCLACSEIFVAEAATDLWIRILLVGLISISVPGLALFQTLVISKRLRNSPMLNKQREDLLKRLSICHSAVWLTASLAIIWAIRWQDVVRGNWELNQWPLLDEAMIIAPVVFSLVASWAIFYGIHSSIQRSESLERSTAHSTTLTRLGYVSLRFRVYFLMTLIPITFVVLARDVSPWIESLDPWYRLATGGALFSGLLAGSPFLILLIWKNRSLEETELKEAVHATCKANHLKMYDIRVWKTDGQVVNALVAGMLPKFRIMLLSDALIKHFPKQELLAVIRHEAGHVRLFHLPTRVGFVAMPLLALAIDEGNTNGIIQWANAMFASLGCPAETGLFILLAIYILYAIVGFSWISHKMEFEADIYACQNHHRIHPDSNRNTKFHQQADTPEFNPSFSKEMANAILRLAAFAPEKINKSTLMHPSLGNRLRMIHEIESSPSKAKEFSKSFARRRRMIFACLIGLCLFAFSIQ